MRSYTQNKDGSGNSAESDYINRNLRRLEELQFYDSSTVRVEQTTRGTRFHAKPSQGSGGSGIQWQKPNRELDPTVAVPWNGYGTLVYLSPQNSLVTTGLQDLYQGIVVKAISGTWLSLQAVPAQVTIDGVVNYNVPQLPYPGASGTPSGTPLKGDLDGASVFWDFISQSPVCV